MARNLVLHVTLHDRFHGMAFGAPEWPPSPARVFQALVAGVARGRRIAAADARALEWLEALAPPRIGAPRSRAGTPGALWVPNNDLDAKEGDPGHGSQPTRTAASTRRSWSRPPSTCISWGAGSTWRGRGPSCSTTSRSSGCWRVTRGCCTCPEAWAARPEACVRCRARSTASAAGSRCAASAK